PRPSVSASRTPPARAISRSSWRTAGRASVHRRSPSTPPTWSKPASSRPTRPRRRCPSARRARRPPPSGDPSRPSPPDRRRMPTLDQTMQAVLALRREAGSEGAATARDLVTAHLESLGYRVEQQRFAFVPSALNGFPIFGAGLGALGLLQLPLLTGAAVPGWAALPVLLAGLAALILVSFGIGAGWLPLGSTREDVNLIATRG